MNICILIVEYNIRFYCINTSIYTGRYCIKDGRLEGYYVWTFLISRFPPSLFLFSVRVMGKRWVQ